VHPSRQIPTLWLPGRDVYVSGAPLHIVTEPQKTLVRYCPGRHQLSRRCVRGWIVAGTGILKYNGMISKYFSTKRSGRMMSGLFDRKIDIDEQPQMRYQTGNYSAIEWLRKLSE